MRSSFLVAIALSVHLFGVLKGDNGHNHKRSNVGKQTENKFKLGHSGAKRERILLSSGPSGHYLIKKTSYRNHKDGAQKKREDYQDVEWLNKCSVGGKRKQLDIPGCGGWVKLDCPGGCLTIEKVLS